MLSAGASESNGQITFPFPDIMRQQVDQQFRNTFDELYGLRERADIIRHLLIQTRERLKRWHKMRVRQKTHIEEQVTVLRNSLLVPKAHTVHRDGVIVR